jgi:hypothetical protein
VALSDINGLANTTSFALKNTSPPNNTQPYTITQTGSGVDFFDSDVNYQNMTSSPLLLTATTSISSFFPAGEYTDAITISLMP